MDPVLIAHVADQLQFDDPDLSYDEAAYAANALLEVNESLVSAAYNYSEGMMDLQSFARYVRAANA